jgi:succinyl-CoA synthetase beta subunit
MKVHEYQAREIFEKYNLPVVEADVCSSVEEAKKIAENIGLPVVIKAQVQVGGRGKAGGIKKAKTIQEVEEKSKEILGMEIKGIKVEKIMVAKAVEIKEELYVGIVVDRANRKIAIMSSPAGGIDIEEIAKTTPEKIFKTEVDPLVGLKLYQVNKVSNPIFTDKKLLTEFKQIVFNLYSVFVENHCSLAEINPLAITTDNSLVACDAKINIDDNALFIEKLASLRDPKSEDPLEIKAKEEGLSYVGLNGDIGCVVNGAGLAMTTMDLIKLYGGEPANFLDVGGSSSPQKVVNAMEIILTNKKVKSILINIFGGITRCDDIAQGLIEALNTMEIKQPIVVRLTGTNEEKAQKMLEKTHLYSAKSFNEGVKRAIELAREER